MGMLFVFTGLGLLLFIGAVAALIWSIRSGQLDDLDTPAMRVLNDDAAPRPPAPPPATTPSEQPSKTP
ncbi:MAG: cbb3-type cytochrome oxidase assembly protein CcoS [Planctomycetes bacterium]|nr:cbb3-type cytochrome oxidase assembly protein CcoS [Planctomycetota bacterium]